MNSFLKAARQRSNLYKKLNLKGPEQWLQDLLVCKIGHPRQRALCGAGRLLSPELFLPMLPFPSLVH